MKRMTVGSHFTPHAKINSKWTESLNVSPKMVKLLDKSTGINLYDRGLGNGFLNITTKAQAA